MVYAGGAFLQWLFIIAEFWFIYHVAGMPLDILQLVYLVGAARLAFLLPLPGGIGALEASQIMVMSGLGLEPAIGMTACVVMRIRDLAVVGVGSALAIYWFSSDNKHMDKT
jgi:uncharacterized membrane protein YbhN (UPF0104 family)